MLIIAFIKTQEYVVLKDTFSLAFYIIFQTIINNALRMWSLQSN